MQNLFFRKNGAWIADVTPVIPRDKYEFYMFSTPLPPLLAYFLSLL